MCGLTTEYRMSSPATSNTTLLTTPLPEPEAESPLKALKSPTIATPLEDSERKVDEIEMIGEELAVKWPVSTHEGITPGMRFLHSSRTIHQLVTDRNRALGLYLAVATLLWTASTALLNAKPGAQLIIPIETLQRWCLPVTLGTMTLLALFTGFLLIRTRIGLIYEVAKMNALLGLPIGRVQRVNVLSLFFIMHAFTSFAGGGSALLFLYHMFVLWHWPAPLTLACLGGVLVTAGLLGLYIGTVLATTSDQKLSGASKK